MVFSKDFSLQIEIGGPASHQKGPHDSFPPSPASASQNKAPAFPLPNHPAPLGAASMLGSEVSCSWKQRTEGRRGWQGREQTVTHHQFMVGWRNAGGSHLWEEQREARLASFIPPENQGLLRSSHSHHLLRDTPSLNSHTGTLCSLRVHWKIMRQHGKILRQHR